MVPLSVLDLAPICEGSDAREALGRTLDLARHAERWGYRRFWLAEHHNMPGIASAATAVVIAHVAGGTETIRVGSGGIMLPNHAPLVVAEQFGTLDALFPGRIDLGLGRAPGTDPLTARALRRGLGASPDTFPSDVRELLRYLGPPVASDAVRAVPGAGSEVEPWMLGSSTFGAELAATLGLPYAFASHFAPGELDRALAVYRNRFRPSRTLAAPRVMLGVNVVAAPTEREAQLLMSSLEQAFVALRRGRPGKLPPPVADFEATLDFAERALLDAVLACSFAGTPETVRADLERFAARTGADELIVSTPIFDHAARLRSYEMTTAIGSG